MRKDRWPELPPGYAYDCSDSRIYITHPAGNMRRHMYRPGTVEHQWWNNPYLAAIAAWKHAYTALKEEKSHAQSIG